MKVCSMSSYSCKKVAMTLNLPLLYFVWTEEYCQTSPNKNKLPNLWHVTRILVYWIFAYCISWAVGKEAMDTPEYIQQFTERILKCVWHKRNDHRPKSLDDFYCDDKIGKAQKNLFHVQFLLHFQLRRLETQFYIQLVYRATPPFTIT